MNIIYPSSPKQPYYDRSSNATHGKYYATGVAPHSGQSRISFTVPAGKVYLVTLIYFRTRRQTAATTAGAVIVDATATQDSDMAGLLRQTWNNNTVGYEGRDFFSTYLWLMAGDGISVSTTDQSTGGSVDYDLNIFYLSYDA